MVCSGPSLGFPFAARFLHHVTLPSDFPMMRSSRPSEFQSAMCGAMPGLLSVLLSAVISMGGAYLGSFVEPMFWRKRMRDRAPMMRSSRPSEFQSATWT